MMTLWETGCRPSEIINLKKSDIDFDKGSSKIFQNKTKKFKAIYLTDSLLSIFNEIENEYLFIGHDKQKEYYAKKFRDLRDSLNLNKEYCLYAFRHSFGTRILNKTKDIHLVSKLLGHSDISIIAKHYINRSDDGIRRKLLDSNI
ncbi:MAG: tyrosine-type recombinase/integrase [Brevinema sp.]